MMPARIAGRDHQRQPDLRADGAICSLPAQGALHPGGGFSQIRATGEAASEASAAKDAFYKAFDGTDIKPDGPSTYAWDPALLVVGALRKLKPDATAEDLRAYFRELKGVAGINGLYDFKAVPNRGLDESNVVVTRWDAAAQTWAVVSDPLGIPRAQ